ncbi:hypothetical protein [Kaarinaea lacus]
MAQPIFTLKYVLLLSAILSASWAAAHFYYKPTPDDSSTAAQSAPFVGASIAQTIEPENTLHEKSLRENYDQEVDRALQFSLEGKYFEAANILIPLAKKGFDRAQLYLAVAYYHGHGVDRDKKKAEQLFFELQRKNFEPGIVHTYLNLLGSLPPA